MPKANPKHKKIRTEIPNMGTKKSIGTCGIEKCTQPVKQHIAKANIEKYSSKLNWNIKESSKKARKIGLCKEHYKKYHKLQRKEEKYTKPKMFDSHKKPSRYKSNAFLE